MQQLCKFRSWIYRPSLQLICKTLSSFPPCRRPHTQRLMNPRTGLSLCLPFPEWMAWLLTRDPGLLACQLDSGILAQQLESDASGNYAYLSSFVYSFTGRRLKGCFKLIIYARWGRHMQTFVPSRPSSLESQVAVKWTPHEQEAISRVRLLNGFMRVPCILKAGQGRARRGRACKINRGFCFGFRFLFRIIASQQPTQSS